MRIVVASDHAGFCQKDVICDFVRGLGHEVEDLGPETADRVDYPDFADKVARRVSEGTADRGILICGTGIGMSLAANKIPGIRCALLSDCFSAEMCRAHNNANMCALGGRVTGPELAKRMVDLFLTTEFLGGRHADRVNMISALENHDR